MVNEPTYYHDVATGTFHLVDGDTVHSWPLAKHKRTAVELHELAHHPASTVYKIQAEDFVAATKTKLKVPAIKFR